MNVNIKKQPLNLGDRTIIKIKYENRLNAIFREKDDKIHKKVSKYIVAITHNKVLKRIERKYNISRIDKHPESRKYIIEKLELNWLLEQIREKIETLKNIYEKTEVDICKSVAINTQI